MPEIKPNIETSAKIKVVGVGGAGGNAINRMIESGIRGVEFIAINTDIQDLQKSKASKKLNIGKMITRGLGAGMNPEIGRKAAEESQNEIRDLLKGSDMVFITCGLGGGTGTGASPVIAEIAKQASEEDSKKPLVIAVVTKPFFFEGGARQKIADEGYKNLAEKVDTIITVSNEKLLEIVDKKITFVDSFKIADNVLRQGVQGISEIITVPGLINADFSDVRNIMADTGSALMGIGQGSGENKAVDAVKTAINSPLLEYSIEGAKGVVFTITGGANLSMYDVSEAAKMINSLADKDAKIVFGAVIDESLGDEIKVTIVATGFNDKNIKPSKKVESEKKTVNPNRDIDYYTSSKKEFDLMNDINKKSVDLEKDDRDNKKSIFNFNSKSLFHKDKIDDDVSAPSFKTNNRLNSQQDEEESELDVPAFIRNKINK
ncbi:MAG TPA: cell division protein FtsZ [bacterium]|nr:cell division protein FtsZ [bacterium]HPV65650.1 cell division protein FtsZ [bacterium]